MCERDINGLPLLYTTNWGPGPQPRHMTWPQSNQWPFGFQDDTLTTEPPQSGLNLSLAILWCAHTAPYSIWQIQPINCAIGFSLWVSHRRSWFESRCSGVTKGRKEIGGVNSSWSLFDGVILGLLTSTLFFHFHLCKRFPIIELSSAWLPSSSAQVPSFRNVNLQDITYLLSFQSPQPGSLSLHTLVVYYLCLSNSNCLTSSIKSFYCDSVKLFRDVSMPSLDYKIFKETHPVFVI